MTHWMLLVTLAQAETTVAIDDISVDGLKVQALRCTLDRGGLLASAMVVGALAAEKTAIDACAPKGTEALTVQWTWDASTTVTHVDGAEVTPKHCLYKALRPIQPPSKGTCTATVVTSAAP